MAAYGSSIYGAANYSYGLTVGAVDFTGASSVSVTGALITSGEVDVASASSMSADAIRIAFMSATVASNADMVVGSNVVVNQPIHILAASQINVAGQRAAIGLLSYTEGSTMACSARLKWEPIADTAEIWTEQPDSENTWTPIN